jgi:hypothetical protein
LNDRCQPDRLLKEIEVGDEPMRRSDQKLQRLLDAAAKARRGAADTAPPSLETRILAQWQSASAEDDLVLLCAFFRHALLGAVLALLLIAAWSFTRPHGDDVAGEAAIGTYEIQMGLNP